MACHFPPSAPRKRRLVSLLLLPLLCAQLLLLPALGAAPKGPRPTDPVLSIPLATLGFDPPQPRLLTGPATMFTLHFVGSTHLLFTFNVHGLIPRLPDATPTDDDRLIRALLLELPSGKIVAEAQWHTRDREQYLWPVAQGLFLLRSRQRLTVLDPLGNLSSKEVFREEPLLSFDRRIGFVAVSPGGDLLTVETLPPRRSPSADDAARLAAAMSAASSPKPVAAPPTEPQLKTRPSFTVPTDPVTDPMTQIRFFRIHRVEESGRPARVTAVSAGAVGARNLVRIPATAEGFLDLSRESPQTWLFDFQSHAGPRLELAPFDTTCTPTPYFISRSEFVAFGCRGSEAKLAFSGFNFRGEQPWIQMLSGQGISPSIVAAPDAGRFAFSRILVSSSFFDVENLAPEEMTAQEIQILQHHDGRTLLKVSASPIQRSGQNFDLSPDGLSFTVIRNNILEVYRLPPLSRKDEEEIKRAAAEAPARNDARIRLQGKSDATSAAASAAAPAAPAAAPAAMEAAAPRPAPAPAAADAKDSPAAVAAEPEPTPSEEPRKPPTLYDADHPKPR